MSVEPDRTTARGVLAPVTALDRWLLVVLVLLAVTSSMRYVDRHGLGTSGTLILLGAAALTLAYSTRTLLPERTWWSVGWVVAMVLLWSALTLVAPSFAWCAVPVAFAVLRVIPVGWALGIVLAMTLVVAGSTLRISDSFDPTLVAGPVGIALVTVIAYRALQRESQARQRLLDELTEAQAELAEEQHRSGALAERTRLSREIHDSVGQVLSSINLLLNAADQSWQHAPAVARRHVDTAAATARDGLDEVRRVVRDLAPPELADDRTGAALLEALRYTARQVVPDLPVEVRVHGEPVAVRSEVSAALVSTARGALANAREHAGASRVAVTLTYHEDEVLLDIRDDGRGFNPVQTASTGLRGRGLRGIRERATALGGHADIESTHGEGTTVSVRFPLEAS